MEKIQKFYENTKNSMPHDNLKTFIKKINFYGNATDLGCGAGRDTIFLIKNNWNVTAIDRENTKEFIESNLTDSEVKKLKFVCQNFENVKLEENDLIVSNYSIPFCSKDGFGVLWSKIVSSIKSGRILCWKFFWFKRFLGIC